VLAKTHCIAQFPCDNTVFLSINAKVLTVSNDESLGEQSLRNYVHNKRLSYRWGTHHPSAVAHYTGS